MEESRNGDCPEEKIAHGDIGVVKDDEMLARFIPLDDKYFIDENNDIQPGALPVEHFLRKDGWSLLRQMYIGNMNEKLRQHAAEPDKDGRRYGYILVKVADIRQIWDEMQRQAICVIDNPQEEMPEHALAQKARDYTKWEARKIRDILLKKFTEVLTH